MSPAFSAFSAFSASPARGLPDTGRIPEHHVAPYAVSAVLLLAFAGGVIAWLVDGVRRSDSGVGDLLQALVDPSHAIDPLLLSPYEWTFAFALLTVALLALFQRRVARGGALLLAFLLLVLCLRQAVGALDPDYRAGFEEPDFGTWLLVTYGAGLAIAVTVLILMLLARERPDAPTVPALRPPTPPSYQLAGVLLIAIGMVEAAWLVDRQWQFDDAGFMSFGDYLRGLVDPSLFGSPLNMGNARTFYEAALTLAPVVVGVLALLGRPVARGAGFVVLGIWAYVRARVAIQHVQQALWEHYFDSVRHTLAVATLVFTILAVLIAGGALVGAGRRSRDVRSDR